MAIFIKWLFVILTALLIFIIEILILTAAWNYTIPQHLGLQEINNIESFYIILISRIIFNNWKG